MHDVYNANLPRRVDTECNCAGWLLQVVVPAAIATTVTRVGFSTTTGCDSRALRRVRRIDAVCDWPGS